MFSFFGGEGGGGRTVTHINTSTFFESEAMLVCTNGAIPVLAILVLSAYSEPSEIVAQMSSGLEVSESEHGVLGKVGWEGAGGVEVASEVESFCASVG
jgi:hypothetical protein